MVLTAETGSGKSTQVPRWFAAAGPVVVVEPRRVACRSLARYVAELEGTRLGEGVGYVHRHEEARGPATRILFVTPGVALRMLTGEGADPPGTVVLDEFHERGQETDLLLGLLRARDPTRLVVMSATLDADRLATFLDAEVLRAAGRVHPVEVEYTGCALLPTPEKLAARVRAGVERALRHPGDVLVFLPGAREIAECLARLRGLPGVECLPLHGSLPAREQDRAFAPGETRRVILATNVAETSVTLPRIGVVVDAGLVRRTLYRWGASSLGLVPVAADSAEQRRGRAGRLGPGRCVRLWSEAGILEPHTPPALHREPLEDLVLRAGLAGVRLGELPLLDPPQPYALEHALGELAHMGAVDDAGDLTDRGRALAELPLDPFHAALIAEARGTPAHADAVDLAAFLSVPRLPLDHEDLPEEPCDATRGIALLRGADLDLAGRARLGLAEARRTAARLRRREGLPPLEEAAPGGDRAALAAAALRAHPRRAFVRRARDDSFTNGGSEVRPDRGSATPEDAPALVALGIRAREGRRGTELLVTHALPVPLGWLADAGLGRVRVGEVELVGGKVVGVLETVYARRVLRREEGSPRGAPLREAAAGLILRGKLLRELRGLLPERLRLRDLDRALRGEDVPDEPADPAAFLVARLETLGVDDPDDLALLEPGDLLPEVLPPARVAELAELFPPKIATPNGTYAVEVDVPGRRVTLVAPKALAGKPLSAAMLPAWPGFAIHLREKNRDRRLRGPVA